MKRATVAKLAASVAAALFLAACGSSQTQDIETAGTQPSLSALGSSPSAVSYRIIGFAAVEGWRDDDHAAALVAFRRSCERVLRLSSAEPLGGPSSRIEDWRPACEAAETVRPSAARAFFETAFTPVVIGDPSTGRVTAYVEAEVEASRRRTGRFQYPIYRSPPEITFRDGDYGVEENGRFRPFPTRAEIARGLLDGRGLELAFLADPVDVSFLQIQGSGVLRYTDGTSQRVGFASKNGHPFRSIARAAQNQGLVQNASFENLSVFVRENPEAGRRLLNENPSYVFFRPMSGLDPNAGPVGALGAQLTTDRSIAVDKRYQPLGAPVWLDREGADGRIRALVVAQDVGSAILGPQRVDLFVGGGDDAYDRALRVRRSGQIITLLPKALAQRIAQRGS